MPKKARLYKSKVTGMWTFRCPCEPRPYQYWHWAAAYGTMLWHMHLYHRPQTGEPNG